MKKRNTQMYLTLNRAAAAGENYAQSNPEKIIKHNISISRVQSGYIREQSDHKQNVHLSKIHTEGSDLKCIYGSKSIKTP